MKVTGPIYVVIVAHLSGAYLPEQHVAKMSGAAVVNDIASGEFEGLAQVLECTPGGSCVDVTEQICGLVVEEWARRGEPLADWQYEFVEFARGTAAANAFARAA